MGLFDKTMKWADKLAETTKEGIDKAKSTIDAKNEEARLAKIPQEGGLRRYEVTI